MQRAHSMFLGLAALAASGCVTEDADQGSADTGTEGGLCGAEPRDTRFGLGGERGTFVGPGTVRARRVDRLDIEVDGQAITVHGQLEALDLAEGDAVTVAAGLGGPFWQNAVLSVRDARGLALAAASTDWYGLREEFGAGFLDEPAVETVEDCRVELSEGCVEDRHRTEFTFAGHTVGLDPGETRVVGDARLTLGVSQTKVDVRGCGTDTPNGWLSFTLVRIKAFEGPPATCPPPATGGERRLRASTEGVVEGGGEVSVLARDAGHLELEIFGAPGSPAATLLLEGDLAALDAAQGEMYVQWTGGADGWALWVHDEAGLLLAAADAAWDRVDAGRDNGLQVTRGDGCAVDDCDTAHRVILRLGDAVGDAMPGEPVDLGPRHRAWVDVARTVGAGCEAQPRIVFHVLRLAEG